MSFFFQNTKATTPKGDWLGVFWFQQRVGKGVWKRAKQARRPRRPRMRVGNLEWEVSGHVHQQGTPLRIIQSSHRILCSCGEVKDRRTGKKCPEFLIGWCDFPLDKDDTWEPITNLPGSEVRIRAHDGWINRWVQQPVGRKLQNQNCNGWLAG